MNKLHFGVAVVGLVLAGALAWWWQNRAALPSTGGAPAATAAGPGTTRGQQGPGSGPGAQGGPAPVEARQATTMNLDDDAQAVGNLQAKQGVILRPEVSGRVSRVGFVDGQEVRQGHVLLQFDDALQLAQVRQAQAQAAIAQTNLQRQRDLLAQNFISQSAVDQSAAALEVAQAQVALNRAQLSRMRLVAPFDGVVGIANVDRGDYVREGTDIVAIEDQSVMTVDFRLPERYASRVAKGQSVEIAVDALQGQPFEGKVLATDSQLDANGRSLLVRATIDNVKRMLRSGMFARARLVFARRSDAVVVPEEALVPQGDKQYVIKLVDTAQGKVSQRVEAVLGVRTAGKVELLKGIAAGDTVVTAGHARLLARDGVAVRIIDLDRAGDATRPAPGAASAAAPNGAAMAAPNGSAAAPPSSAAVAAPTAAPAVAPNGPAASAPGGGNAARKP